MAVEIKSIDGWKAAAACNVPPDTISELKDAGVTVLVQPSKVSFMHGKETLAAFMCKAIIIGDAANGVIQPNISLKAAFKNTAKMAFDAMKAKEAALQSSQPIGEMADLAKAMGLGTAQPEAPKPSVLDLLVKNTEHAPAWPTTPAAPSGVFPLAQLLSADTVELANATMLYQPVSGTGGGSRYFVVAMRDDLKVAARYLKNGKLSVRVEGSGIGKHSQSLDAAGFSPGAKYRSLHVVPGNDLVMAGRTLGSILMGMNIDFTTVTPKIGVIAGKGN